MNGSQRRLVAIAFTDMVGYTSLAQRDEALALRTLDVHNSLVRTVLAKHQGREVKTIGDAFLLEFDSALEAVLWAIELQVAVRDHAKTSPGQNNLLVKIGIHVGDVTHHDGDVLGDAVNIASRVVNFAEGGGICFSEQVYAQVRNKLPYSVEKMPEQRLKNVELEMTLYRVALPWAVEAEIAVPKLRNRIAVLPFSNISPDPNDSYLADGMTEELISVLSEVKGLRVIARTSVNRYRDATKGVRQIANELQVSHLLEGSVRKGGNRIRVTAQLIEAESQEDVWTARYERALGDILSIQSSIAESVASSLKIKLLSGEKARIEKKETENITAYVAYLKGRTLLREGTETATKEAREQFELAVREDPAYAKAYAGLSDTHLLLGDYLFAPFPVALEEAKTCAEKALELDPNLAEARVSLANLFMYDNKFDQADREFRRAIEVNPSYATGHHWYSVCLMTFGRRKESLEQVLIAEELDPLSPAITMSAIYRLMGFGMNEEVEKRIQKLKEVDPQSPLVTEALMVYGLVRREWKDASIYLTKMIEEDPADPYLDMDLAYFYAVTGRREETMPVVEKLKSVPDSARIKGQLLAFVYNGLNDLDEAFVWLNYAFEHKEMFIYWIRGHPLFEAVRRDPRYVELLKRAGLPLD